MAAYATYAVALNKALRCEQCKARISKTDRDNRLGCSQDAVRPVFVHGDIRLKRCPANYWSGVWQEIFSNYGLLSCGVLPFEGGLFDQPSKMVEAYGLADLIVSEARREAMKDASKPQRSASGRRRSPTRARD